MASNWLCAVWSARANWPRGAPAQCASGGRGYLRARVAFGPFGKLSIIIQSINCGGQCAGGGQ